MGSGEASSGSPEVIVLPAIPWLRDGIGHEAYLESCLKHIEVQEIPSNVKFLPPFITSPIADDVKIPAKYLYHLTVPKLNEIVDELQKFDATHVIIFDADSEPPPRCTETIVRTRRRRSLCYIAAPQKLEIYNRTSLCSCPHPRPHTIRTVFSSIYNERVKTCYRRSERTCCNGALLLPHKAQPLRHLQI